MLKKLFLSFWLILALGLTSVMFNSCEKDDFATVNLSDINSYIGDWTLQQSDIASLYANCPTQIFNGKLLYDHHYGLVVPIGEVSVKMRIEPNQNITRYVSSSLNETFSRENILVPFEIDQNLIDQIIELNKKTPFKLSVPKPGLTYAWYSPYREIDYPAGIFIQVSKNSLIELCLLEHSGWMNLDYLFRSKKFNAQNNDEEETSIGDTVIIDGETCIPTGYYTVNYYVR